MDGRSFVVVARNDSFSFCVFAISARNRNTAGCFDDSMIFSYVQCNARRVFTNKVVRLKACLQLALAIRDEVQDLEAASIPAIQMDEPAIREALSLHRVDCDEYLKWATTIYIVIPFTYIDMARVIRFYGY
ncbi:hypothetical protein BDF22DRAFT_752242 [Syncephalis plumigaleata]|nr:hypothetical protein BDF22DRAFT_752242 [Syncephalis plumigaleata]